MEHYNGRIVAIDASMAIYQFLVRPFCLCPTFHPPTPTHPRFQLCTWGRGAAQPVTPSINPHPTQSTTHYLNRSPSAAAGRGRPPPS